MLKSMQLEFGDLSCEDAVAPKPDHVPKQFVLGRVLTLPSLSGLWNPPVGKRMLPDNATQLSAKADHVLAAG